MNNLFSPHGAFQFHVSNTILIARLAGSWNVECSDSFSEQFKHYVKPLIGKPWGHLVILDEWQLGVPQISTVIYELVTWCIDNGLEKSAQVYSDSMIKQYHLDKMIIDRKGNFERQVFRDTGAALQWLNQYGFAIEKNKETHLFITM